MSYLRSDLIKAIIGCHARKDEESDDHEKEIFGKPIFAVPEWNAGRTNVLLKCFPDVVTLFGMANVSSYPIQYLENLWSMNNHTLMLNMD